MRDALIYEADEDEREEEQRLIEKRLVSLGEEFAESDPEEEGAPARYELLNC